jgi:hypothetical protein
VIVDVTSPVATEDWAATLTGHDGAMADHQRAWFATMACRGRWRDASRRYRLDDGSTVVVPLVERGGPHRATRVAASPPSGAGFGGLIGARATDPEVQQAVLRDLRDQGWLSVRIRPVPESGRALADAATATGAAVAVARRAHLLDLDGGPDAVLARMRKSTRRGIRRHLDGTRGFEVVEHTGPDGLEAYEHLRALSIERWAETSREPLELARWRAERGRPSQVLRQLAVALGDGFRTWVAYADGRPAAVNIAAIAPTTHVLRAAMDRDAVGSSGVMQYLDWLTIERAHAAGSRTVNLGESGTSSSLGSYKESLGAVAHDYAEVRLERLPITPLDAAVRRAAKRAIGFVDPA